MCIWYIHATAREFILIMNYVRMCVIYNHRLLTTAISPAAASTLPSGLQLMCEGSPLTHSQRNLCHQYPELFMYLLRNGTSLFQHQCHHQFKHEKWNCSNINLLPLFGTIQPFLSLGRLRVVIWPPHDL